MMLQSEGQSLPPNFPIKNFNQRHLLWDKVYLQTILFKSDVNFYLIQKRIFILNFLLQKLEI